MAGLVATDEALTCRRNRRGLPDAIAVETLRLSCAATMAQCAKPAQDSPWLMPCSL